MDPNSADVELLFQNPSSLLWKYQEVVLIIVQVYHRSGYFQHESKEELIQRLNDKLLDRMDSIRSNYNGKALLKTYFSAIVKNMCAELIRERRKENIIQYLEEPLESESYEVNPLNRLIIKQELSRLEHFLRLFGPLQQKLEICIRALYRLPMQPSDFYCCCRNPEDPLVKDSINILILSEPMMEKDIFFHLNCILNQKSGRQVQADALRKWVKSRIRELIEMLNGNPKRSEYSEETLQILIEKYFIDSEKMQQTNKAETKAKR